MPPQKEATQYIQDLLASRRLAITPRTIQIESKEWIVFEYRDREIRLDPASGVWIRLGDEWKCLATPCNVSGGLRAVEFLSSE